jgi:hypothetical protein
MIYFCVDGFSGPAIIDFLVSAYKIPVPKTLLKVFDILNLYFFALQLLGLTVKIESMALIGKELIRDADSIDTIWEFFYDLLYFTKGFGWHEMKIMDDISACPAWAPAA